MEDFDYFNKCLESYTYVIFYFQENSPEVESLLKYTDENTCCIDLKTSDELAEAVKEKYGIKKFPALLYRNKIIYYDDEVEDRMEEIDKLNIEKTKKFIKEFVLEDGITVFIKGTIEKPYCRYTKQLVKILDNLGEKKVKDFDIFTDQNLRYYLKIVNSWQTYPMIYVNGKFIGGLDLFIEYLKNIPEV